MVKKEALEALDGKAQTCHRGEYPAEKNVKKGIWATSKTELSESGKEGVI